MRVLVITPPAPIVAWADLDEHLRLGGDTARQTYVEGLAAGATGHIDGPDGYLGRAFNEQVLELRLNSFACSDILLPCPDIVEVQSVKYLDVDGVEQTIDPGEYELAGGYLSPAWGKTWPTPRARREAVRVRYKAASSPRHVAKAKEAILLIVGDFFAARETFAGGSIASIPSAVTVDDLLNPMRVYA